MKTVVRPAGHRDPVAHVLIRGTLLGCLLALTGCEGCSPPRDDGEFVPPLSNTDITAITAGAPGQFGTANGIGAVARFNGPRGVAVDLAGNVYVADTLNHAIRKISPAGEVTTLAGSPGARGATNGTGSDARFNRPWGVAVDRDGNVYVADTENHAIRKISPTGVVTTLAGLPGLFGAANGTGSTARFRNPKGVAVDPAGNVYVADSDNHMIRKITSEGEVSTLAGSGDSGADNGVGAQALFFGPQGVAVDSTGNVWVADTGNMTIRMVTSGGLVTTQAGSSRAFGAKDGPGSTATFSETVSVAVHPTPRDALVVLIVSDSDSLVSSRLRRVAVSNDAARTVQVTTLGEMNLSIESGVAVDAGGAIYVAEPERHTVRRIVPQVEVLDKDIYTDLKSPTYVVHQGKPVTPFRIWISAAGVRKLFDGEIKVPGLSIDRANQNAISGTPTQLGIFPGIFSIQVVPAPSSQNGAAAPAAVLAADAGKATPNTAAAPGSSEPSVATAAAPGSYMFTTLAGSPGVVVGASDGIGSAARFQKLAGAAVDGAGNLYVADSANATIRKITSSGVVTTLAGSPGLVGFADGTGSAARFNTPTGVAVDPAGNLYVADSFNATIRKITSSGVVTTLAGSPGLFGAADGTGSAARFAGPVGVAVDSAGNVYVAETLNRTIRKITSSGVVTTLAGSPGAAGVNDGTGSAARFTEPWGVAVDPAGNVTVVDSGNGTIRKITSSGVVTTLAGTPGFFGTADGTGGAARFTSPIGVAVDSAGNAYIADTFNHSIRKITSGGVVTTLAGSPGAYGAADGIGNAARFNYPVGVAVDAGGSVYVADSANHTMRRISSIGVVTTTAGSAVTANSADGTGSAVRFYEPRGLAVGPAGNTYVADSSNHTIRRIASSGAVTVLAGSPGASGVADGTGTAARFNYPKGVAADSAGNVYVADTFNHAIRKISGSGVVTTLAGLPGAAGSLDGSGGAARFNYPSGVAVDLAGNVYVADYGNQTIRKITSGGVVTTLAGAPGAAGFIDGPANAARFYNPAGVVVDGAGNLFVADSNNGAIRKITSGGTVTTLAGSGFPGSTDGSGSAAQFSKPTSVALDGAGNVYVADSGNQTIRMVSSAGAVTTVGGSPGLTGATNGIGSAARFKSPAGIAVDSAGKLYVADFSNNTIRLGAPESATAAPTITVQPASQAAVAGGTVTFTVTATGMPAPTYQWRKDGVAIAGATASSFTVNAVSASSAGSYTVVVTDGTGAVTSAAAVLAVTPAGPNSALSNLSVRTTMASGQILTVGAVVSGGAKTILIRVGGPALTAFGLDGMVDPRLELYTSGPLPVATNDDWPATLSSTFSALGAFPFVVGSKDAALSQALGGSFTVQAKGTGPGSILVEAYDVTGGVSPRLVNLSARSQVGIGSDILIAGFNLAGTGSKQLLIRAVGPGLAAFGVPGTLTDPTLQVISGSGILVASNDNWTATLAPTFTQVGAFALPPLSRDAAVLVTLPAGASYTVQVSGVNNGTGEALIEIYEVL